MPNPYSLFVRMAILLADGASMFSGFAIIGFVAYKGSSPLPFLVILSILLVGTFGFYAVRRFGPSGSAALALYGGTGLIVSYVAVAGLSDLWWMGTVLQGRYTVPEVFGAVLAFLLSGYLWFHAASLVLEPDLTQRLVGRFRFGLAWFVLALIIEVGSGRDLHVGRLLWVFLIFGLAAIAVNRFGGGFGTSSLRLRLTAFMVLFVVGLGALAGVIGDSLARGIWSVVSAILRWPLEVFRDAYLWTLGSLFEPIIGEDLRFRNSTGASSLTPDPDRLRQDEVTTMIIGVDLQGWAILAIFVFLGYLIYRFYLGPSDDVDQKLGLERETLDEAIPFVGDSNRLIRGTASLSERRPWKAVEHSMETDGRREAFEIYCNLVAVACDHGHEFDEAETPNERLPGLETVLPGVPIGQLTELVNTACYAGQRIDALTIDRLQREVDEALLEKGR